MSSEQQGQQLQQRQLESPSRPRLQEEQEESADGPLCLPLQILRHNIGRCLISHVCSKGSLLVRSICKEFLAEMDAERKDHRQTSISDALGNPGSISVARWILSIDPDIPDLLLYMCGKRKDTALVDALSSHFPEMCSINEISTVRTWKGHVEMRSLCNLLALCDGAVEGGHVEIFNECLDRILRGLRERRPFMVGLLPWFGWLGDALDRGHWNMWRAISGTITSNYAFFTEHECTEVTEKPRNFVRLSSLRQLSKRPMNELEESGLPVLSFSHADRSGLPPRPWMQALKGDADSIEASALETIFPEAQELFPQGVEGEGEVVISEVQKGVIDTSARLVGAMMEAASCGGHPEVVRRIYVWGRETLWSRDEYRDAFLSRLGEVCKAPDAAAFYAQWELMDWFEGLEPSLEWSLAGLEKAALYGQGRLTVIKRLKARATLAEAEIEQMFRLAVKSGNTAAVEFLFNELGEDISVMVQSELCQWAVEGWNWNTLKFLRERNPVTPWGQPECPEALREYERLFVQTFWADADQDPPPVPEGLGGVLSGHIVGCIGLEAENPEALKNLSPLYWLKRGNCPAFTWLMARGGEFFEDAETGSLILNQQVAEVVSSRAFDLRGTVRFFFAGAWNMGAPLELGDVRRKYDNEVIGNLRFMGGFGHWEDKVKFHMKGLKDFFEWADMAEIGQKVVDELRKAAEAYHIPGGSRMVAEAWRGTELDGVATRVWGPPQVQVSVGMQGGAQGAAAPQVVSGTQQAVHPQIQAGGQGVAPPPVDTQQTEAGAEEEMAAAMWALTGPQGGAPHVPVNTQGGAPHVPVNTQGGAPHVHVATDGGLPHVHVATQGGVPPPASVTVQGAPPHASHIVQAAPLPAGHVGGQNGGAPPDPAAAAAAAAAVPAGVYSGVPPVAVPPAVVGTWGAAPPQPEWMYGPHGHYGVGWMHGPPGWVLGPHGWVCVDPQWGYGAWVPGQGGHGGASGQGQGNGQG
uniref:Uncharacterized protein n=1 Tax=Chromera velia CCMP2878 TaxID=1169474 RepID=A0A0G4H8B3_9ALVE|eukprot:Cvel_5863.t1-p1 / transcript=Cvel_5863.t1 / gene=Cvel_5863 / organism=Chromera_velia_CCMP2878 / gene_product=Mucin-2, putative / transcript_product=Mucin-2, putative / location=Cvel_scaffold279:1059-4965(+) / protein_length=977 / sequence_SO=supercontig / SO=protein_coding / is_pseudo=false